MVGLTLSKNQRAYTQKLLDQVESNRSRQVFLRGWEEFDDPVDRIVSIEAFEAFGKARYKAFFDTTYQVMPDDGRMVLQTIYRAPAGPLAHHGHLPITISDLKFMRFVSKEIFPGGEIPSSDDVVEFSQAAGFSVADIELLTPHYVRTLQTWADELEARRSDAIAVTSEEVYERYMRYLTGCADFFQRGVSEVAQFTLTKG